MEHSAPVSPPVDQVISRPQAPSTRDRDQLASSAHLAVPEIRPITSLRGVLGVWVVLFHLGTTAEALISAPPPLELLWRTGDAAVDVFFLLSGFVIWLVYAKRVPHFSWNAYGRFLWARLARLYPVHIAQQVAWLALVACAAIIGVRGYTLSSLNGVGFVRNLFLVQAWEVPMQMYWNYPAWSLSMEWLAYLATPLVFLVERNTRNKLSRCAVLLTLWVALIWSGGNPLNHYFRIGCAYTTGALVASSFFDGPWARKLSRFRLVIGVMFLVSTMILRETGFSCYYTMPLAAMLVLALANDQANTGMMNASWLVYSGKVSYSLYMTHALAVTVMRQVLPPSRFQHSGIETRVLVLTSYVAFVAIVAIASYTLVEKPARAKMAQWLRT